MPRKRHKPEEIVAKLRQVDVLASQGQSIADAVQRLLRSYVRLMCWLRKASRLRTRFARSV